MTSHGKIAQFNWECTGRFTEMYRLQQMSVTDKGLEPFTAQWILYVAPKSKDFPYSLY